MPIQIALRASLAIALASAGAACATDPAGTAGTAVDGAPALPPEVTAALDLPQAPFPYAGVVLPAHFGSPFVRGMDNTPADNPITDDGATLGRVLVLTRHLRVCVPPDARIDRSVPTCNGRSRTTVPAWYLGFVDRLLSSAQARSSLRFAIPG